MTSRDLPANNPASRRATRATLCLIFLLSTINTAAASPPQDAYPASAPWTAKWIWAANEATTRDFYLYVRKDFTIPANAISAKIRVTADSRYKLYINGTRIGQGPVKSSSTVLYYDEWNVTQHLKSGKNIISALAHHYGEWTFSYMQKRGGFLLEADILLDNGDRVTVATDGTWKALPGAPWRKGLSRMSVQQGFNEVFDARKAPAGWNEPDYDDSKWQLAQEIAPAQTGPWKKLTPRKTPDSYEEPFFPKQVISAGDATGDAIFQGVNFSDIYKKAAEGAEGAEQHLTAYAATFIYLPTPQNITFTLSSRNACKMWSGKKTLISNYLGLGIPYLDQAANNIDLPAGWSPLLIKCVSDNDIWTFTLSADAADKQNIIFSSGKNPSAPGWSVIGPYSDPKATDLYAEFKRSYPPQKEFDPNASSRDSGGNALQWTTIEDTDQTPVRLAFALSKIKMSPPVSSTLRNLDSLASPSSGNPPAEITTAPGSSAYVILDFGWEVSGYPHLEVESQNGGETIDLCYAEVLEDEHGKPVSPLQPSGRVNCARGNVNYADRYTTRPGRQDWETFDKRAFRYMLLVIRGATSTLKIKTAALRYSVFNAGSRGKFESSSELLNRIWTVGAYTLLLNMDDSYTDCPWRERGQWWGDARIEILVNYYAFGDSTLARRGILQIAESQRDDGLVAGIFPTEWDNRWLPDYALIWITSAMDYYRFTGDATLLPTLLPAYEKMLDGFFATRENSDRLLQDVPHWVFIDWAPVEKRGAVTALNAFYYQALVDAAEQFRIYGDNASAEKYDARAQQVKDSINRLLWDDKRGVYADCYADGRRCETISEQANSLAVLFGIAPASKRESIMKRIMDPTSNAVRAGSPYFSYYILGALRAAGENEAAVAYIRRWGDMLKWGATTWWETWDDPPSYCHAWSSAPTYDLSRRVLGVWPLEPGFSKISVEPVPGDLAFASGVIPSPIGDIAVGWVKNTSPPSFEITIDAPASSTVEVWLPVDNIEFPSVAIDGSQTIPKYATQLKNKPGSVGVMVPGGRRKITVSEMSK